VADSEQADRERPVGTRSGGTAHGVDPDNSGGPHATGPGDRPVWSREEPAAARQGFRKALVIVLGVAALFLIGIVVFAGTRASQEQTPSPLSRPGATQPSETAAAGQSGAQRPEPLVPPQSVGTGQTQGGGGEQTAPDNPRVNPEASRQPATR
jgi:hypothetical protein